MEGFGKYQHVEYITRQKKVEGDDNQPLQEKAGARARNRPASCD